MSRVVISGYYGFGNAGDEAVLAAILGSLRRQAPGLEYCVLSVDPAATERLHGVTACHRNRPREVLSALRGCDLFISGGGSLLQDVTSLNSLLFYLAQIRLAKLLRRRVMIYAQGIGPLRRPAARRLTARALRGVDWITVRDADSAAELRRLGLGPDRPPVEVTADPVFTLRPATETWAAAELRSLCPRGEGPGVRGQGSGARGQGLARPAGLPSLTPRPSPLAPAFFGISVREWPGLAGRLDGLAEVIRAAAAELGLMPLYFPLQRAQDSPVCRQLARQAGGKVLEGDYTAAQWMALAGRMDLFLGMRLHALIFAAASGVPLVGLSYDPKVTALLSRLGERPAASVEQFEAETVRQALRDAWNEREQRSVQITGIAGELAAAAEVSTQRAVALLSRGPVSRVQEALSDGQRPACPGTGP